MLISFTYSLNLLLYHFNVLCLSYKYIFILVKAIRCYQCSSDSDPDGTDVCGAYESFEKDRHVPVDCSSDETTTPGTFCMKEVHQSPKGFICKFALFLMNFLYNLSQYILLAVLEGHENEHFSTV